MAATSTVFVGDAVVDVGDFAYSPRASTLPVGSKVVWVLRNGNHSVTADDAPLNKRLVTTGLTMCGVLTTPVQFPVIARSTVT
jgi:plastocyanin